MKGSIDSGLLVIDKPCGPTSHDVVARVRKVLGLRSVGHAGTLDPRASGVLLVMLGEGTKLSRFLALEEKSYRTVVKLGQGTSTLDAEGEITQQAEVSCALLAELAELAAGHGVKGELARALQQERERRMQLPPAFSAIKQKGTPAYVRARRGEQVELEEREVRVRSLQALGADPERSELELELTVSKGYYVRALARDLGERLGLPAHLVALRRTRTGPYSIEQSMALDDLSVESAKVIGLAEVARGAMPVAVLTDQGVRRARFGQAMSESDFVAAPTVGVSAWLSSTGELVAIGDWSAERPTVVRAFGSDVAKHD